MPLGGMGRTIASALPKDGGIPPELNTATLDSAGSWAEAGERGEVITPDNGSIMARHSLDNASREAI